jgi:hypothetical protein
VFRARGRGSCERSRLLFAPIKEQSTNFTTELAKIMNGWEDILILLNFVLFALVCLKFSQPVSDPDSAVLHPGYEWTGSIPTSFLPFGAQTFLSAINGPRPSQVLQMSI